MKSSPVQCFPLHTTTHAVELANASGASMSLHAVELVSAEHEPTNSGALGALTTVPTSGVAGLGTDCEFPCN